jgi:hypothetical protein
MKIDSKEFRVPHGKKVKLTEWPTVVKPFACRRSGIQELWWLKVSTSDPQVDNLLDELGELVVNAGNRLHVGHSGRAGRWGVGDWMPPIDIEPITITTGEHHADPN